MGIKTVCLTGNNSNDVIDFCDAIINVPSSRPDRIQEMHIAIGQIICEKIEQELC